MGQDFLPDSKPGANCQSFRPIYHPLLPGNLNQDIAYPNVAGILEFIDQGILISGR